MSLLDILTGGASGDASAAQQRALEQLQAVQTPSIESLSLPELEKYAVSAGMTPAQMQAFLQSSNAYNDENVDQTGTAAQKAALSQLADVANSGAEGSATQKAQIAQVNQDAARNLAGQRGAIEQQAQARGVPVGLLQAALQSQNAGSNQQDAHMAALQSQGQNYQQALQALASGGALGGQLQGQQNTQANTIAQAQNAMQQFNAANQQQASGTNAQLQQQANSQNTQNANQAGAANTGLANQRTQYNAGLPQQNFNNQMQKATGVANQYGNIANTATGQGQQNAGLFGSILGAGATALGGPAAGIVASGAVNHAPPASANTNQYSPLGYAHGAVVPGHAQVPGDHPGNDTVLAKLSPGEAIIPRSSVSQNPMDVMRLLSGRPASVPHQGEPLPAPGSALDGHNPADLAALLAAMKHMRGAH